MPASLPMSHLGHHRVSVRGRAPDPASWLIPHGSPELLISGPLSFFLAPAVPLLSHALVILSLFPRAARAPWLQSAYGKGPEACESCLQLCGDSVQVLLGPAVRLSLEREGC